MVCSRAGATCVGPGGEGRGSKGRGAKCRDGVTTFNSAVQVAYLKKETNGCCLFPINQEPPSSTEQWSLLFSAIQPFLILDDRG